MDTGGKKAGHYLLVAIAATVLAVFIGYYSTLHISGVSVDLRGSSPAVATNISLPYSPPSTVMTGINHTVFSSDWFRIKPDDCMVGMLGVVGRVCVDLSGTAASKQDNVTLPFSRPSEAGKSLFTVAATINYGVFSSGLLRIAPDDCIQSIQLNGNDVASVKKADKRRRCFPRRYTLDLSPHLRLGANSLRIDLTDRYTDKGGLFGINMVGLYSQPAVLAMVACVGLALYAGAFYLLEAVPKLRAVVSSVLGRMCVMSFLPCFGVFAIWATIANNSGHAWPADHIVPTLAAVIVSFALLLRLLDESRRRSLSLSLSYPAAAVSLTIVAYASMLLADRGRSSHEIFGIAVLGVVAGFFASVPDRQFVERLQHYPRAVVVTIVAALSLHAYWHLNLLAWVHLSGATSTMVRGILWVCGFPTTTFTQEQKGGDGHLIDYWAYVSSSDFSVKIGSWCSGFEAMTLFIFLLSLFVLLDWNLFSKVRHLWAVYILTVPFVLVVNAMRIAGLFLYAEWYVWRYNRSDAMRATVAAFHSNIGWVIYSVAFAVFLPLVYRWAKRAAKVR